jgi:hypothetical protein
MRPCYKPCYKPNNTAAIWPCYKPRSSPSSNPRLSSWPSSKQAASYCTQLTLGLALLHSADPASGSVLDIEPPLRRGSAYNHPRTQNTWGADPAIKGGYTTYIYVCVCVCVDLCANCFDRRIQFLVRGIQKGWRILNTCKLWMFMLSPPVLLVH